MNVRQVTSKCDSHLETQHNRILISFNRANKITNLAEMGDKKGSTVACSFLEIFVFVLNSNPTSCHNTQQLPLCKTAKRQAKHTI